LKQWKTLWALMAGRTSSFMFKWIFGKAKEENINSDQLKDELKKF